MIPLIIHDWTGKPWAVFVELERRLTDEPIIRWSFKSARSEGGTEAATIAELEDLTGGSINGIAISKVVDARVRKILEGFGTEEARARAVATAKRLNACAVCKGTGDSQPPDPPGYPCGMCRGTGQRLLAKTRPAVDACPECHGTERDCRTCGGFGR